MEDLSAFSAKPRLRLLLDHFAKIKDTRQAWKVAYPLREVLFLVVCGTIANGDDYDDIVDWGKAHLSFLRGFAEFHFGIPCADWLRTVMNRIDPDLFMDCFSSWVAECWPDKLKFVAIDGKTSRRSHNRKTGQKALHLVSAFATNTRLVLGQEAVDEKSNEIMAIPALVERLDLEGALVSIDAIGCNPNIAQSIVDELSSGGERQPADAPCRYQELFRNGAIQRGRAGGDRRQGARPDRGSYPYGFPCGRLDRSAAFLSGCPSLPENQHDRHGREPDRARRQDRNRTAILYLVPRALGRCLRRRGAKPLGNRKQPALDPRRDLQRGSVTPAHRSWRQKHGSDPPLRPQSGAPSRRQAVHQAPPQARQLGPKVPAGDIGPKTMLTSTRCPEYGRA